MSEFLRDDQLDGSTEEQLRAHYQAIADEYVERIEQVESARLSPEAVIRAFANYSGCRPEQIIYVPAAEAGNTAYLFEPLTQEELKRVSSWTLGEF